MTDEDALVEKLARVLCEQHIRTVRRWDTPAEKLERMLPDAVDYGWLYHCHEALAILPIVNARLDAVTKERDELRAKTLKVENCILCADECRGHSLGDSAAWEPEEGSRDWLNFQLAAAQEKLAMAEGALSQWKCPSCGGSKYYKNKGWRGPDEFVEEELPCTKCEQTGLHSIASTTLAALREPAAEEGRG